MFSEATVSLRKDLRKAISEAFPFKTSFFIFESLKPKHQVYVTFNNLIKYFRVCGLGIETAALIFAPYGIRDSKITQKQWKTFFDDDFCLLSPSNPVPEYMGKRQIDCLKNVIASILKRTGSELSTIWVFMMKFNPSGSSNKCLRVSAFCHVISELGITESIDMFIDSLFSFLGKHVMHLEYQEFVTFVKTFI